MDISKMLSYSLIPVVLFLCVDARSTSNQKRCVYSEWRNAMNCRGEGWEDVPYEHLTGEIFSVLDLGGNEIAVMKNIFRFRELPDSYQVTDLLLDHNKLSKVPSNLYRVLPGVQSMDLSYNNIEHVSKSFCRFENLTDLYVGGNPIKSISKRLSICLPHLKIYADENTLTSSSVSSEAPVLPSTNNLDDYFASSVGSSEVNTFTNTNDNDLENNSRRDKEISNKASKLCVGFTIFVILFSVVIIRNN